MAEKIVDFEQPCPLESTNASCGGKLPPAGNYADTFRKWQQRVRTLQNRKTKSQQEALIGDDPFEGHDHLPSCTSIRADLATGVVVFKDVHKNDAEGQPYICVRHNTPICDVVQIMEHEWKITIPTIVLEIISGVNSVGAFPCQMQWKKLQRGFVEAANKTNMWIVTHGLNVGMGKFMGEIADGETTRRQIYTCQRHPKQSAMRLPKLTLLGMVQESSMQKSDLLDGKTFVSEVLTEGNNPKEGRYDLNPYHTHFVVVRDDAPNDKGVAHFVLNFANYLRSPPLDIQADPDCGPSHRGYESALTHCKIPLIALLISGGYTSTSIVADHLRNCIPVVVVKGSGGAADLLSFAYEEIKSKNRGAWDPDYVDNFITDQVSKKIAEHFCKYRDDNIARNKFRDKILECVRLSHKDERVYLDFLDIHSSKCDLTLLNEYLLQAMFRAEERESTCIDNRWQQYMQKDIYLALDWNCPHICDSQMFHGDSRKYNIEPKLFERALLRQGREAFVELFLDRGFKLHPFLTRRRYFRLFERAEDTEFYRSVCLESALGYPSYAHPDEVTLVRDVNWMIFQMTKTKNFVCMHEHADTGPSVILDEQSHSQERRALHALVIWAVFMNRHKLAKVLWKRADYPIHLALLVSMMYDQLAMHISEKHIGKEMEDNSKEFAAMADGVLTASFEARNCRALEVLSEEVAEFNHKTAVEIAALANNRSFIAHPCCQKWLTTMFYGDIRIRDIKFGFCYTPDWLKIILSAFLFFPMNIWIIFQTMKGTDDTHGYGDERGETLVDCSDSEIGIFGRQTTDRKCTIEGYTNPPVHLNLADTMGLTCDPKKSGIREGYQDDEDQGTTRDCVHYPFWKKIATMWGAPITKFWTHQIFYVLYLTLFSLAVVWPSCGNYYLDVALWCWTLLILFEDILITYIHYWNFSSVRLATGVFEIVLISLFLVTFMFVRILAAQESYDIDIYVGRALLHGYGARVTMCLGLLYFFYRFIWIYFPIDPTLGRLLFRIRLMVVRDFMHFLRLALLFIVSSGIAIHSVIYPDYPMSWELMRRIFHKAWFTLFITPIEDLHGEPNCRIYHGTDTCRVGPYENDACPVTGVWPYIITIQYLIILKLILITLLFALFSDTANKLAADADAIWRYQRYHLVLDFCARPRLPAPLNIISFIIILFKVISGRLRFNCGSIHKRYAESMDSHTGSGWGDDFGEDFYWRSLAFAYLEKEALKELESKIHLKQMESINTIMSILENVQASTNNATIRMDEFEKCFCNTGIMLEEVLHMIHKEDRKFGVAKVHLLSRQSPYPNTRIKRFPLADRYVPWEVHYSIYDPVIFTKPCSEYPAAMRDFVDEDLLLNPASVSSNYTWNFSVTSGAGVLIDRKSWMTQEDLKPVTYKLDGSSLPMNPMGRTGLRGRGCLCRWGPNHSILVVITRWTSESVPSSSPCGTPDDQKNLEVILTRTQADSTMQSLSLPGGFEHGECNPYNVVRKFFIPNQQCNWDSSLMESYFSEYAREKSPDFTGVAYPSDRCSMVHSILFRGYVDDTRNTDNAWVEAEVWHFHYTGDRSVCIDNLPHLRWKKYSADLESKMIPSHACILRDIHHKQESCG